MIRYLSVLLAASMVLHSHAEAPGAVYTPDGFRLPTPNPTFEFPRDHGSHPSFKIEWWYITGHLDADGKKSRYGFQGTFFRFALAPPGRQDRRETFGTNQIFMAHMAVVDPANRTFIHEERLNRDGWDAFAAEDDLHIRNGNWSLRRIQGETMELCGTIQGRAAFDLTLVPAKPLVTFGENGVSRKGADVSAASWYLTFPRLSVTGSFVLDGNKKAVTGEAWMDHEISSSQLGPGQVGWDWASVRLHEGREIMVYILRDAAGQPDPHSQLVWIDEKGALRHFGPDHFSWKGRTLWTSPETGGTYPIDIDLSTTDPKTGKRVTFRLRPLMQAQEMVGNLGGISYWEGACEVLDAQGRRVGESYVELTGYAQALGGGLR